jgi:hypothetical protein
MYVSCSLSIKRKTTMKLFKLTFNETGWDEYLGFIIRAKDRNQAIAIAKNKTTYTHKNEEYSYTTARWNKGYKLKEITIEGRAGIILDSFNAG